MCQFSDVKSDSDEPQSFMFKWIFDILSINMNFDPGVHAKRHKRYSNDINNKDHNFRVTIRNIVGWKVFNYGLSFSIVDSLCRFVISS